MNFSLPSFIKTLILALILTIVYCSSYLVTDSSPSVTDIALYLTSLLLLFLGARKFGRCKYDLAPIFNLSFFSVLLFSCYNISELQTPSNLYFVAIVLIGGGGLSFFLTAMDKLKIPIIKSKLAFDANNIILIVISLYIFCKIIIIYKTGFRLEALLSGERHDGGEYVVPGLSGLAAVLQWSLLMAFPLISRKIKISIIISIALFSLLAAKRGDVVRMIIYLVVYYLIFKDRYLQFYKPRIKIISIILFFTFAYAFSYTGNARQHAYDKDFSIVEQIGANYNNDSLAWMFGYTGINFEVLSRVPLEDNLYFPMSIVVPFSKGLISTNEIAKYYETLSSYRINGFNASTFLGPMVHDMGEYFWIELILFMLALLVLIFCAKLSGSVGSQLFIMSLIVLLPFGNYFLSAQFYYAILFSSILTIFMKKNYNVRIKGRI